MVAVHHGVVFTKPLALVSEPPSGNAFRYLLCKLLCFFPVFTENLQNDSMNHDFPPSIRGLKMRPAKKKNPVAKDSATGLSLGTLATFFIVGCKQLQIYPRRS
jgi:hypothetical protein